MKAKLHARLGFLLLLAAARVSATTAAAEGEVSGSAHAIAPVLGGDWKLIATNPVLGDLATPRQEPVDFGIWQAADSTWQIWSCIRATAEAGKTRLFHRWEGASLDGPFRAMGIAMRADPSLGETPGGMQAPFVIHDRTGFRMFYGDWEHICSQESQADDGKRFTRILNADGKPALFSEGAGANTRDPMLIEIGDVWHCYYTAHPNNLGSVYVRTSRDLVHWSDSRIVSPGGANPYDPKFGAECPFVVEPVPGEFFLFLTQRYGRDSQTTVVHSRDPMDFDSIRDPSKFVCLLPVAAPEIFEHDGRWHVAAVDPDYKGIRITTLTWREVGTAGNPGATR